MSKFFFKGCAEKREDYGNYNYETKRKIKMGTENSPLTLTVASEQRKAEVEVILQQHTLFANIQIDSECEENITEMDVLINTPKTILVDKIPGRNDPCSCGSGKKYKKCCG
jgi:SWIM/SEC-C metal-binding protein